MLEITISDTEKLLLERTGLFKKNHIISFCLLLSYGKLDDLIQSQKRSVGNVEVNVVDQLQNLDNLLKEYQDVRIWYSGNENEDMNTTCFLINYLSNYSVNIYLCNVMSESHFGLGCYNEKEVKHLLDRTVLLKDKEKDKYIKLWKKLEKENLDLRIIKNDTINSYCFDYLDKKILEILKETGSISYWKLIAKCMMDRVYNYCSDFFFKARIDYLIETGQIKIDKTQEEKNFDGEIILMKYISLNEKSIA